MTASMKTLRTRKKDQRVLLLLRVLSTLTHVWDETEIYMVIHMILTRRLHSSR